MSGDDTWGRNESARLSAVRFGEAMRAALAGSGMGFAVLIFDFGDRGTMAYYSDADRAGMIAAIEELLWRLRNDDASGPPPNAPPRVPS